MKTAEQDQNNAAELRRQKDDWRQTKVELHKQLQDYADRLKQCEDARQAERQKTREQIKKRKQLEQALQQAGEQGEQFRMMAEEKQKSIEFLETVINSIDDPIFVKDERHRWTVLNDSLCRLIGFSREYLIGKSDYDLFPKEQADVFWEKDDHVFETEETDVNEEEITGAGELRTISTKKSIFRDPTTGERFLVGTIRDITDEKRAEADLQASEMRFRSLVEQSPFSTVIYSRDGRMLLSNPAGTTLWNVSPEELSYLLENYNVLEDEVLIKTGIMPYVKRAFAGEAVTTPTTRMVLQDYHDEKTKELWISGHIYPVKDTEGRVREVVIMHEDITQRKRAEAALQQYADRLEALRDIDQAILSAQSSTTIAQAALKRIQESLPFMRGSLALFDFETGEGEIVSNYAEGGSKITAGLRRPLSDFDISERMLAGQIEKREDTLAMTEPPLLVQKLQEEGVRTYLGIPLLVQDQLIGSLYLAAFEPDAFTAEHVATARGIARSLVIAIQQARLHEQIQLHASDLEQRVAERTHKLRQAYERLQEMDRLKSKFIADVTHELRTPVTNLSLYLDLLESGKPENAVRYRVVLKEQTDRLKTLVEDTLNLSRLDLAQEVGEFTDVDLNQLVKQVVRACSAQTQVKELDLIFEPGVDLPLVRGEQTQLTQMITNLLQNAINYTFTGEVRVSTGLDPKAEFIALCVQDTGIGIVSEEQTLCFDSFYRGKSVGQLNIPGAGLGLTLVKRVVDFHNGRIEVESQVDRGSAFTVWLPVKKEPDV